jgi:transcriptional regulator with XRE-family HTH domain
VPINRQTLKLLRKARGYPTQQRLADASGVSLKTISRIEAAKSPREQNAETEARLARALGTTPEVLSASPDEIDRRNWGREVKLDVAGSTMFVEH